MMNDCPNVEIRDALPDFMHGTLDAAAQREIDAHVGACVDCAQELSLLRAVRSARSARAVDVSSIVQAIPAPLSDTVRETVRPTRSFGFVSRGVMRLAAALAIAAIGVGGVIATHQATTHEVGARILPALSVSAGAGGASGEAAGVALVGVNGLSDDRLETLITEMATLDASPPADQDLDMDGGAVQGGV